MSIRFLLLACTVIALCLGFTNRPAAADVPKAPTDICPILLGTEVPSVEVRSVDGDPLDLKVAVQERPTILIFYRGGW